eukprot:3266246-Rhodomonas_salina.1
MCGTRDLRTAITAIRAFFLTPSMGTKLALPKQLQTATFSVHFVPRVGLIPQRGVRRICYAMPGTEFAPAYQLGTRCAVRGTHLAPRDQALRSRPCPSDFRALRSCPSYANAVAIHQVPA